MKASIFTPISVLTALFLLYKLMTMEPLKQAQQPTDYIADNNTILVP